MPSERKTWGCGGRDHDRLYRGHYSGLGHRWRRHGNRCRNLDGGGRAADHIVRSRRHRWLRRYLRRRVTCRGLAEQHRGSCNCYQSKYTCRNFTICDLWFSEGSLCKHSRAGDTVNCIRNKKANTVHPHLYEAHQRARYSFSPTAMARPIQVLSHWNFCSHMVTLRVQVQVRIQIHFFICL